MNPDPDEQTITDLTHIVLDLDPPPAGLADRVSDAIHTHTTTQESTDGR